MPLTFVAGSAADVFAEDLARAIDAELRRRFPAVAHDGTERYESEPVEAAGWRALQKRVLLTLDAAPQLTTIDAYQAVYVPDAEGVDHLPIANLADPLQVGSLPALLEELRRFAAEAALPTDDLELMKLAAHYLETDDVNADLDVQTYVQLLLSAKQAVAHNQALWVVT